MKRILIILILLLVSCGSYRTATQNFEQVVDVEQLRSICKKEGITTDLREWGRISYDAEETEISQWFYISERNKKFYSLRKTTDSTFVIKINPLTKEND